MPRFRAIVRAGSHVVAFLLLGDVHAQEVRATVKSDSLPVYDQPSAQNDSVRTLTRDTVVAISLSITNGEGVWCSVSGISPAEKLGYVRCEGLERPAPNTAAAGGVSGLGTQTYAPTGHSLSQAQKAWGLAASALLVQFNRGWHDTLAAGPPTPQARADSRRLIQTWWNVANRDDLLNALAWIDGGGHRQIFNLVGERASKASPDELQKIAARLNPADANGLRVAQRYYLQLGSKSITGWDYSRYIFLCRMGYSAGFLSEDEAWQRIIYAARILQATFSSWHELGENYLIGREFWSLDQTRIDGARMRAACTQLLQDPGSPWNRNPWNLNLE